MVYPHTFRAEHSETKTTSCEYGAYYSSYIQYKVKIQPDLLKLLQFVDANRAQFTRNVSEAIAIKSISSNLEYKDEVNKMVKFAERWLTELGIKYECFDIGYQTAEDGTKQRFPPIILGTLGKDPKKKTVSYSLSWPQIRSWPA